MEVKTDWDMNRISERIDELDSRSWKVSGAIAGFFLAISVVLLFHIKSHDARLSTAERLTNLLSRPKEPSAEQIRLEPTPAEKSVLVSRKASRFATGDHVWLMLNLPRKFDDAVMLHPRYVKEVSSDGKVVRLGYSAKSEGGDWYDATLLRHADLLND